MLLVYANDCFRCRHKAAYRALVHSRIKFKVQRTDIDKGLRSEAEKLPFKQPFAIDPYTHKGINLYAETTPEQIQQLTY